MNVPEADRLVEICFKTFETLSKKGKPILGKEWTVLSCIAKYNHISKDIEVVALGTGTKCIGINLLSKKGDVLNDSHAEVMCRRGFLIYLYEQLTHSILKLKDESIFFLNHKNRKFEVFDHISFHFVTTHAPCGDASIFIIEKTMGEKKAKLENDEGNGYILSNSSNFTGAKLIHRKENEDLMDQTVGELRTKPGRGEATSSVSCSDKLSKWNVLGVQGSLIYSFMKEPIYIQSITFCDTIYCNVDATKRAIWQRFENTKPNLPYSFRINRPIIQFSKDIKFKYEKKKCLEPSSTSLVWSKSKYKQQVAVHGKRQGVTKKLENMPCARMNISKIELFRAYIDILKRSNDQLCIFKADTDFNSLRYFDAKDNSKEYQQVWNELKHIYFGVWSTKPINQNMFQID